MIEPNSNEILLGVGHDFIPCAEQIISQIKDLRLCYFPDIGIHVPVIHVVDHDIEDENGSFALLKKNEYVIYFYGAEKIRASCEPENYHEIVDMLKSKLHEDFANCHKDNTSYD